MRIQGSNSGNYLYHSLPILLILACAITTFGKKGPNGNLGSQLAISSVGPSSGPTTGGTLVTVTGAGFTQTASVSFGGVTAPAVTYVSSTQLQAIAPSHASGTVSVAVTEHPHNQSTTLAGGFTYGSSTSVSVSAVSPAQGPTTGGTVVTVTGTGFQTGATVKFGSTLSTAVTVASSTQLYATSPTGSSGTVAVSVTNPTSQSGSLSSAFTYTSAPTLSSVSPNTGPVTGGTTVTILGSGFQSGTGVAFGGIAAASVTFVSPTEIHAVSPSSAAGTVSIAIANSSSQTATLAAAFTYFHMVGLAWTDSSSGVSGYNVYRSSTSGGPFTRLNSTLLPSTAFNDHSVQAGLTYFYVATAVDSNNKESGYSNQARAVVPSP